MKRMLKMPNKINRLTILSIGFMVAFCLVTSCNNAQETVDPIDCAKSALHDLNYTDMLHGVSEDLLLQTVELPNEDGALSRNRAGYFSVRFQMNMSKLTDLAISRERVDALRAFSNTLTYAFAHQNRDGSYQLTPPQDLIDDPSIDPPTKGDSVSAVAFFGYALSISLNAMEESQWYATNSEISEIKSHISSYGSNIEETLKYLIRNESTLRQVDAEAPNRLLFDAIAFYGLGKYTEHAEAQALGIEFSNLALSQTHEDGYFIEGGGWDSSYNGVAVMLGLELYSMLPADHPSKNLLASRLACATEWQASRILPSGQISTEGNTRVYQGGESFLGNEKAVDAQKTIRTFYYYAVLSGDKTYVELADLIFDHYR